MKNFKYRPDLIEELKASEDSYRCLAASTAHLANNDLALLEKRASATQPLSGPYSALRKYNMLMSRDTGWFIKLYDEWELNDHADHLKGLSGEVLELVYAAHAAGYRMIEFDCAAKQYEWPDHSPDTLLGEAFKALCPVPDLPKLKRTHIDYTIKPIYPEIREALKCRVPEQYFNLDVDVIISSILENYVGEFLIIAGPVGANLLTLRPGDSSAECTLTRRMLTFTQGGGPAYTYFLYGRQRLEGKIASLKTITKKKAESILIAYTKVAASTEAKKRFDNYTPAPDDTTSMVSVVYAKVLTEYFPEGIPK